jgi:hypothetical protein
VWLDPATGATSQTHRPGLVLWPADPVWGVWRVDHIVELRHGGADNPSNYTPVPERMHTMKTQAMRRLGDLLRSLGE